MVFNKTSSGDYYVASREINVKLLSNGDVDGNKYDDLEEYGNTTYTCRYNY